jgi:hypothetical protein
MKVYVVMGEHPTVPGLQFSVFDTSETADARAKDIMLDILDALEYTVIRETLVAGHMDWQGALACAEDRNQADDEFNVLITECELEF